MPFSNYNSDYFYLDSDKYGSSYFSIYASKNTKFSYIVDKEYIRFYEGDLINFKKLEFRHLQEVKDMCKKKGFSLVESKDTITDKFTVEKLLIKMGIQQISIQYRCSKAIKEHKNREIVAYSLGLFGGLIITKKFNEKNGYCAYKFVLMDEKYGRATFSNVEISKAIKYLESAKEMGYYTVFPKKEKEKLNSYAFMKGL